MNVLTNIELYKVAFVYTFSRLFLLICIIYIPIWLNELMKLKTGQTIENIAIIPLTFFASSFVVAVLLKFINQNISQNVCTYTDRYQSIPLLLLINIIINFLPDHLCNWINYIHIWMHHNCISYRHKSY